LPTATQLETTVQSLPEQSRHFNIVTVDSCELLALQPRAEQLQDKHTYGDQQCTENYKQGDSKMTEKSQQEE